MRCSVLALEFLIFAVLVQRGFLASDFGEKYIGCYRDDGRNRAMGIGITSTSLTLNMCLQRCRHAKSTFFGVEYHFECYCADTFEKHGRIDNCNRTCSGNQLQICGGVDALSVYTVCPRGHYGLNCNDKCYCNNHTVYGRQCFRNGTCPAGCQTGWNGSKCDSDVNECNGTLQHHNCDHYCNNTAGSYTCSCQPGYTLNSDGRKCDGTSVCSESVWGRKVNWNSLYGIVYPSISAFEECLEACLLNVDCLAVDYDIANSDDARCWLHVNESFAATGAISASVNQYTIKNRDCVPRFGARWRVFANKNSMLGVALPDITNLLDCQRCCIAEQRCTAVDFVSDVTAANRCWLHVSDDNVDDNRGFSNGTWQYVIVVRYTDAYVQVPVSCGRYRRNTPPIN